MSVREDILLKLWEYNIKYIFYESILLSRVMTYYVKKEHFYLH